MNGDSLTTHQDSAAAYLQQLQELAYELEVAMKAIASNALSGLQQSVARQEMICSGLGRMARMMSTRLQSTEPALPLTHNSEIDRKIRATTSAILGLNLQYASLLKHSGRSIALLSSLCRSHTGYFREDRGSRLKHQTWSCEM